VKTEEQFCLPSPLPSSDRDFALWCGGVQRRKKRKRGEERKNSPGHLAADLTCSLAVRSKEEEKALFPTQTIFRFKDW